MMKTGNPAVLEYVAAVLFALLSGILVAAALAACAGWDKKTCAAIDLAHKACTVVTYLDDDGKERQVSMSNEDARELGKMKASRDAGK